MNRAIDYRRQWAGGSDLTVHIVGYGGARACVTVQADGGPPFSKVYGSQDEAVQKLPEIVAEYDAKLKAGRFTTERETR